MDLWYFVSILVLICINFFSYGTLILQIMENRIMMLLKVWCMLLRALNQIRFQNLLISNTGLPWKSRSAWGIPLNFVVLLSFVVEPIWTLWRSLNKCDCSLDESIFDIGFFFLFVLAFEREIFMFLSFWLSVFGHQLFRTHVNIRLNSLENSYLVKGWIFRKT